MYTNKQIGVYVVRCNRIEYVLYDILYVTYYNDNDYDVYNIFMIL